MQTGQDSIVTQITIKTIATPAHQMGANGINGSNKHPKQSSIANDSVEAQYWQALSPSSAQQQSTLGNGTTGQATLPKVYYFHTDQLGMPQELTNAQGQLVWQASYKTWGSTVAGEWEVKTLSGNAVHTLDAGDTPDKPEQQQNLRFQGQYLDRDTGLHYNTFRYYDPDMGRFICPDPIGLSGGMNLGSYAPNPIGWIDPWGWANCHGKTAQGNFDHFSGTSKPLTTGAIPNSLHTHIDPNTGKAIQNAVFDANGNVIGHVDFKNHGIESGHYHQFLILGNPASGHGPRKPHLPHSTFPPGWDTLPAGVSPHTPIGQ